MQHSSLSYTHYSVGHPWYYLLGGSIPSLKEIQADVRQSGYQGYLAADITTANQKAEPARSAALRQYRERALSELKRDISGYRKRALELHRYRAVNALPDKPVICDDIHTNISLKHSHLVNDFAHLITLDELLNKQGDLFGG